VARSSCSITPRVTPRRQSRPASSRARTRGWSKLDPRRVASEPDFGKHLIESSSRDVIGLEEEGGGILGIVGISRGPNSANEILQRAGLSAAAAIKLGTCCEKIKRRLKRREKYDHWPLSAARI